MNHSYLTAFNECCNEIVQSERKIIEKGKWYFICQRWIFISCVNRIQLHLHGVNYTFFNGVSQIVGNRKVEMFELMRQTASYLFVFTAKFIEICIRGSRQIIVSKKIISVENKNADEFLSFFLQCWRVSRFKNLKWMLMFLTSIKKNAKYFVFVFGCSLSIWKCALNLRLFRCLTNKFSLKVGMAENTRRHQSKQSNHKAKQFCHGTQWRTGKKNTTTATAQLRRAHNKNSINIE